MEISVEEAGSTDSTPRVNTVESVSHDGLRDSERRVPSNESPNNGDSALRLPTSGQPDRSWYWGARVWEPDPGKHQNVIYLDLWSLYPNAIRTCNMSPETLVGTQDELEESEWTEDDCVWSYIDTRPVKKCEKHEDWQQYKSGDYKAIRQKNSKGNWVTKYKADEPQYERLYFLHPDIRRGFISDVVDDFMELKDHYDGTDKYGAIKRVVNSTYGFLGFSTETNSSRLFDWRIAEAVTLFGRRVIQWTAQKAVERISEKVDGDVYVTHGDTDGVGIAQPSAPTRDVALTNVREMCEWMNNEGYEQFLHDEFGVDEHWMEVEMEYYAPSLYCHDQKKRYALWRTWDEGEECDDLKITGFEAIRSDVADITQEVQSYIFEQILYEDNGVAKENVYQYLRGTVEEVREGDRSLDELGVRSGFSKQLENYGSEDRTPRPIVRGSKYAAKHIDGEQDLDETSKPMKFPIDRIIDDSLPRTYDADTAEDGDVVDAIAVENPENLHGKVIVDREKIIEKQIRDRVTDILDNMGWSWSGMEMGHEQTGLENYW